MTTTRTNLDAHGNPMTGDATAIARYDRALDLLLRYHPDVVGVTTELATDESVAMGQAMFAYLNLLSTDADDLDPACAAAQALSAAAGNERERMHAAAVGAWVSGDWTGAAATLDELLQRWPTDLLALVFGHQLDFFLGDAQALCDRPARTLRELDPEHPHTGFVRGMASFGLEEAGHYGQALAAGLAAVEANPDDVWGIHAVVHTFEMQGMIDDGIRFLAGPGLRWKTGNLFTVHNWWHLALYHLEAGLPEHALAIYDAEVHNANSAGVPIEMLDASALLWRLHLDGVDVGGRFAALAESWAPKLRGMSWYVFNDLHGVMALAGARRLVDARDHVARLASPFRRATRTDSVQQAPEKGNCTNAAMTAEIGLPACRAIIAYAEGRHEDVVAELYPIRRVLQHFGGSHAQRDALQRTLLESSLRAGRYDLARALTGERLAVREQSVYSWTQRARALRGIGRDDAAADAERHAGEYRSRFSAAAG